MALTEAVDKCAAHALAAVFCVQSRQRRSASPLLRSSLSERARKSRQQLPNPHSGIGQGAVTECGTRSRLSPLPQDALTEHVAWPSGGDLRVCVVLTVNRGGPQQAISSSVPRVVCKGTLTVWLMDSEWFATGSQELWENRKAHVRRKKSCHVKPRREASPNQTLN